MNDLPEIPSLRDNLSLKVTLPHGLGEIYFPMKENQLKALKLSLKEEDFKKAVGDDIVVYIMSLTMVILSQERPLIIALRNFMSSIIDAAKDALNKKYGKGPNIIIKPGDLNLN